MKNLLTALFPLALLIVFSGCSTSSDDFATVRGRIIDDVSGRPVSGAAVVISSPAELSDNFTSTDTTGAYIFGDLDISTPTDITLQVSKNGYNTFSTSTTLIPSQEVVIDVELELETTTGGGGTGGGGTDDEDDIIVEGEPGIPAAIVLNSVTNTEINIRQTGGIVNSRFSFSVQDSSGRAMDANSPTTVNFRILNGPGGGEAVVPSQAITNNEGNAITSLFSGDSAGVVRIEAFIEREDGARIASSPVIISVSGGFPSPDHFFVAPENRNLEGFGFISQELEYNVVASVGDKFGNPVREGTAVDFRSLNAGIIRGSAQTNANGFASVAFYPNGSRPDGHPNGIGFFTVRAHTFDENNNDLETDELILFTTREANITFAGNTFDVPANGAANVSFSVTDLNGYPMAAGTRITVEASTFLSVTGDAAVTLGDFFTGGAGITDFTVSISDVDEDNSNVTAASVTVTVTTPSGNETISTLGGTRAKVRNRNN